MFTYENAIEILNVLNHRKVFLMEERNENTVNEKGDYIVKGRTIYKESFINGFRELYKESTFTKTNMKEVFSNLIDGCQNAIKYYEDNYVQATIVTPDKNGFNHEENKIFIKKDKADEWIEKFNFENRHNSYRAYL